MTEEIKKITDIGSYPISVILPSFINTIFLPNVRASKGSFVTYKTVILSSSLISRISQSISFLRSGVLGQKIKALSERDKQKVALGRAIVCQPKVLLVDEDFARQDPEIPRSLAASFTRLSIMLRG